MAADGTPLMETIRLDGRLWTLPTCEECGLEDDNLENGVCRECEENCLDTSWGSMRKEYGTW